MQLNGMYGNAASWSQLAVKAVVGASSITLRDKVAPWPVGGTIAIASTDFDMNQAETRVITAVRRSKWGGRGDGFPRTFSELSQNFLRMSEQKMGVRYQQSDTCPPFFLLFQKSCISAPPCRTCTGGELTPAEGWLEWVWTRLLRWHFSHAPLSSKETFTSPTHSSVRLTHPPLPHNPTSNPTLTYP